MLHVSCVLIPLQAAIEKAYGSLLSVHANRSGSMRSETHCTWFLLTVLKEAARRARALSKLPADAPVILIEDQAPGHHGDKDGLLSKEGHPDAEGWKAKRQAALKAIHVHRSLLPRHGTPELCPNDQLHGFVHAAIKREMDQQLGFDKDLTARPRSARLKAFMTPSGGRRGPTEMQVARAFFRAVANIPTTTIAACYTRCGFISKADMASLLRMTSEAVDETVEEVKNSLQEPSPPLGLPV